MLAADSVQQLLADPATREATLAALESHGGPHELPLALAAAPALTDLLALDRAEVGHALFRRVALLRARLVSEHARDASAIWGAAHAGGREEALFDSPGNVLTHCFADRDAQIS